MAAGGHFGFWPLLGLAHTFARGIGAQFFSNTSKYPNPLSNLPLLSVVTGGPNMTLLLLQEKSKLLSGGGGGHLNTSVVHRRDQRNTKKGLFSETERDSQESQFGVKTYLFSRKSVIFELPLGGV